MDTIIKKKYNREMLFMLFLGGKVKPDSFLSL